jgi:WD repeat-containing protein 35
LRIALAIDSYIFFANIRPDYKWCYFADTCVYTYTKAEQTELSLVFWNMKTNEVSVQERRVHYINLLRSFGLCDMLTA